jgi:hypothetical protein
VPADTLTRFLKEWKPQVQAVIARCDAAQARLKQPIQSAYADLTRSDSYLTWLCVRADDVADQARQFCTQWNG